MSEAINQVGGGGGDSASFRSPDEKSWLMETAYVRCRVVADEGDGAAAAAGGVPWQGPLVVELLGPGWCHGGHMEIVSVAPSMINAVWQVVSAMGLDVPAELTTGPGRSLALLRVRVRRLLKGGVGSQPAWWSVNPCGPRGEWLGAERDFSVNVPEGWLIERGVSDPAAGANLAAVERGREAVVRVGVEAAVTLEKAERRVV